MKKLYFVLSALFLFNMIGIGFNYAQKLNMVDDIKSPQSGFTSKYFFINWYSGPDYRYHLTDIPVTNTILKAIDGEFLLSEGTRDRQGYWWAVNTGGNTIFQIDITTGDIVYTKAPLVGCKGISYNPIDNRIYYIIQNGGVLELWALNLETNFVQKVQQYVASNIYGLACSNSGEFYSFKLAGFGPIVKYSANSDVMTQIGTGTQTGSFLAFLYGDMEFDLQTNKLYLNSPNALNLAHEEIREINLSSGTATLFYDFGINFTFRGLCFSPGLLATEPSFGQTMFSNQTYTLSWENIELLNINVDFSSDNGATWSPVARDIPSTNAGISWTVPQINSTNCYIKYSRAEDPNAFVYSPRFTVENPFPIVSPSGGEMWLTNSDQIISWYQTFEPCSLSIDPASKRIIKSENESAKLKGYDCNSHVRIEYTIDGGENWVLIASDVLSTSGIYNRYTWQTPGTASALCKIRISSINLDGNVDLASAKGKIGYIYSVSDSYFTLYTAISNKGRYVITSPNGKEVLSGGAPTTINWRKVGGILPGTLQLEYSTNSGQSWSRINTTPIAGIVKYNWMIPNVNSTHCLVRLCNYINHQVYDVSDKEFTIAPQSEALNYPNPFNPTTKIVFNLEKNSFTSLKAYNSIGQEVAELVNRQLEAGAHEFEFNASKLPSGIYFYNLTTEGKSEVHKMILLK